MPPRVIRNITEFSDDILLQIFSNLNSTDLLNIIETCGRFNQVGRDHSLWKRADFSDGCLTALQVSRRVLSLLHSSTSFIHLQGHGKKYTKPFRLKADLITPSILRTIGKKCSSLEEFHVSEAVVNAKTLKLEHFQEMKGIHTLSFVDCEFVCLLSPATDGSYFKNMPTYLPMLRNLEVSYSNWITDFDLMVLSKLDNLKKLVLKCDLKIGFTTAYLAISFRFGFKSLEELDLRGTSIQNSDIQSVVQSGKLKTLKLGPIGYVKRLTNDLNREFGLVIPDPRKREEPKQQIVVINLVNNGPRWRHASDDDLEEMGLQWVKKELNRCRRKAADEPEPLFLGKEGQITDSNLDGREKTSKGIDRDESSMHVAGGSGKRKLNLETKDANEPPMKRPCGYDDEDSSEAVSDDGYCEDEQFATEDKNLPDKGLSDELIPPFRHHAKTMNTLVLNGCAITDSGLLELVRYLPVLTYIDVSNSHVTPAGIQQAQVLLPQCRFIDNEPLERR